MIRKNIFIAFALMFFALIARAETIKTSIGSFEIPDGLKILDRDEAPDKKTGKPAGMIVFTKANDVPRAVFIVTWSFVEPGGKEFDPLDAAVKIGNPFNKSLTGADAVLTTIGGARAGRYEGTLPNGLSSVSYVTENHSLRLVILLKNPPKSPYGELASQFARGIESFTWVPPAEQFLNIIFL